MTTTKRAALAAAAALAVVAWVVLVVAAAIALGQAAEQTWPTIGGTGWFWPFAVPALAVMVGGPVAAGLVWDALDPHPVAPSWWPGSSAASLAPRLPPNPWRSVPADADEEASS